METRKTVWIDHITERFFAEDLCKFVVMARIKENGVWRFERFFFDTKEEMDGMKEGSFIIKQ